ncbi:hypothetical protein [Nannocystis exedens]|uniref:hypothetical protein n=1 Tax=Nannocystis exedens TaxID=54 RepID=UPI0011605416|nr:hypothetical protein [Nannocystis exedens]
MENLRLPLILSLLVACAGPSRGPGTSETDESGTGQGTTDATGAGTSTTGTGTTTESPTGSGSTGETTSLAPCEAGDHPGPEVPLQCAACIVVDDAPGFCADGVLNPACVDGTWKCVEDTIPRELCPHPGAPCQLDEDTTGG